MQLCLKNCKIKSCTRNAGDCIECRPGRGFNVEKMTLHQLTEFSGGINDNISELIGIAEDLNKLHKSSKVGNERKRLLLKQIKRLIKLVKKLNNYGQTVTFNLAFINQLDDESAE